MVLHCGDVGEEWGSWQGQYVIGRQLGERRVRAHAGVFGRDQGRVRAHVGGIERVTSERGYLTRYVTWIHWCACEDAWDTWDGEAGPGSGIWGSGTGR
jgi:hypothetical protein